MGNLCAQGRKLRKPCRTLCRRRVNRGNHPESTDLTGVKEPAVQLLSLWKGFIQRYSQEIECYRRLLFGRWNSNRSNFFLARWIFLRLLGLIYCIAFGSLWTQIAGLAGQTGILPAAVYIDAVWNKLGVIGLWTFPTLCWFSASDAFLHILCACGVVLSILLTVGILPIPGLVGLWTCYLSLATVCRTFLGFQWDALLLEVGFLAIFLAPAQWLPNLRGERKPLKIVIWLFHWLLFRLMFSSGVVKLNSGDASWRNLTALNYHYETQPIPNIVAWHAHQFAEWFQNLSVLSTLIIELIIPFLILAPRRLRLVAFVGTVGLQVLILTTGNYCFFNILTIALCILLLDDATLSRLLPKRFFILPTRPKGESLTAIVGSLTVMIFVIPVSLIQMKARVFRLDLSEMERRLYLWTAPYHCANSYGLFANMTESRPEIIVEGSMDGKEWKSYEFKWKPGNINRAPSQAAPHQPRLDWQMWFEALNYLRGQKPTLWFQSFLSRLLVGEKNVLKLLEQNPFPDSPPKFVRAVVFDYHFTTAEVRKETGNWWRRDYLGVYVHPSKLDDK